MKKFYIGTTLENLISILKGGSISTCPPHRVWEEYSQNYVYLVPYMIDEDHEIHEENPEVANEMERILSVTYAFEQADFAVYELGHTKRVVMEITGIDESLLSEDKDAQGINAVKYPKDIPVSCISKIMVDANNFSEEINTNIAITKFYQKYQDREFVLDEFASDVFACDEDGSYIEMDYDETVEGYKKADEVLGIKHASLILMHNDFSSSEDLSTISEDLRDFLGMDSKYYEYSIEEFEVIYGVRLQQAV